MIFQISCQLFFLLPVLHETVTSEKKANTVPGSLQKEGMEESPHCGMVFEIIIPHYNTI
jgi:hypothetical protein